MRAVTRFAVVVVCTLLSCAGLSPAAHAGIIQSDGAGYPDGAEIGYFTTGVALGNTADYNWWYGCSVTAAGMLMGHYDRNGYADLPYSNLVPGGVAEADVWGASAEDSLIRAAMASEGHQRDFYSATTYGYNNGGGNGKGYGEKGDDRMLSHSFDSLADFMGTSQDSASNVNGGTTFYHWTNGAKLYDYQLPGYGLQDRDGMYGLGEYLDYAGYGHVSNGLYTQLTDNNQGTTYGFTFANYMAEIDAGRPVIIHVTNHSMYGYGYDAANNLVYLHDTWSAGQHSMTWGGSYSGSQMWGVTALELNGGGVLIPEPASFAVWSLLLGLAGVVSWRRRGPTA